jgi:hypothetical protein
MKTLMPLLAVMSFLAGATSQAADKTLIDYFLPIPAQGPLSPTAWGAPNVLPRDPLNGLEDQTMKQWDYWDGRIIKGPDGKYNMFASRWDQAVGHNGWNGSKAIHAVSDSPLGPYVDKGLLWPDNEGGKGHNVEALALPDGRYAVMVSETRPLDVFISSSLDGPWEYQGTIKIDANGFSAPGRASNDCPMVRPDGSFEIVERHGIIMISKDNIMGPYEVQGTGIFSHTPDLPTKDMEDPVIWYSGGMYHIVVNCWSSRVAYHLTSPDGIHDWKNRGVAYDPDKDFIRYTDGTVNHWNKIERPGVYLENGHVAYFTFGVIDIPKEDEKGNDGHGSKVIVVPFDGVAFDRDMGGSDATPPAAPPAAPTAPSP